MYPGECPAEMVWSKTRESDFGSRKPGYHPALVRRNAWKEDFLGGMEWNM